MLGLVNKSGIHKTTGESYNLLRGTKHKGTTTSSIYNKYNKPANPIKQTSGRWPQKGQPRTEFKLAKECNNDRDAYTAELLGIGMEDLNISDEEYDSEGEFDKLSDHIDDITLSTLRRIRNAPESSSLDSDINVPLTLDALKEGEPNRILGIYDSKESIKNRKASEMYNYQWDNNYTFEDFTLFKKYEYDYDRFQVDNDIIFFLLHSSWSYDEELGTTLEFGGNVIETNASIHVTVTGFNSNFYVKKQPQWDDVQIKIFISLLNNVVLRQYKYRQSDQKIANSFSEVFIGYDKHFCTELKDYVSDDKSEMIKIYSLWPSAVAAARQVLNEPSNYDWPYSNILFNVFEADVDYTQRFFLDCGFKPSMWFKIPGMYYELMEHDVSYTASLVVKCRYTDLEMLDTEEYMTKKPNFSIISYDTEWKNIPRRFVHPDEDPIIVISMNAYRYLEPDKRKSLLFVYTKDGLLPSDLPKVDHFYWYRSEPGLLNSFKEFLHYTDVDYTIDYNGAHFDMTFIANAGVMYFGKKFLSLGRHKYKPVRFSASEWRNKTSYNVEIPERVSIDMLKVVRGTPLPGKQFNGYSLGHVSQVLLGDTKIEFDVNLTDTKWRNINTISEIWKYGDKDAWLPGKLADNMNVINITLSTSQMTSLTSQKILNRGAGCKIEGFLRKICFDKQGVERVLLECVKKTASSNRNIIDTCAKEVVGANVLKPKTGFYKTFILVFDFNSEYPSIMISLNLCLSTFVTKYAKQAGLVDFDKYWTCPTYQYTDGGIRLNTDLNNSSFIDSQIKLGILPQAEDDLWNWRDSVKADMKKISTEKDKLKTEMGKVKTQIEELEKEMETEESTQLKVTLNAKISQMKYEEFKLTFVYLVFDGLQTTIKQIMNGAFGQTIFPLSRFYKKEIGSTILQYGRYMLNYVKYFIESTMTRENGWPFDANAIYGDTDSVFVELANQQEKMEFPDAVKYGRIMEVKINENFVGSRRVRMIFEKMYKLFLITSAKNYIGLKYKSLDDDSKVEIDTKGMKHKKSGTSPLAQKTGRKAEHFVFMKGDIDAALDHIRKVIVSLKKRKVTASKLVFTVNVGKDLTPGIHQYMQHQINCGNKPQAETEATIREKFAKLPADVKSKTCNATISTVYAYRQLCKDPTAWTNRGMTINYIYVEGIETAKRELIASVDECVELDLPYNVNYYMEEIMRITSKIMALIVGDVTVKDTPIYRKLITSHPSVFMTPITQHVSFFDSRFGCNTIKIGEDNIKELEKKCDNQTANKVMVQLIEKYKSQKEFSKRNSMNSFFTYIYKKCIFCAKELHPFEELVCGHCTIHYAELLPIEMEAKTKYKEQMDKCWKTCSDCLKSDTMDPMDCVNITCHNFTKRLDATKEYYISHSKLYSIVQMENNKRRLVAKRNLKSQEMEDLF